MLSVVPLNFFIASYQETVSCVFMSESSCNGSENMSCKNYPLKKACGEATLMLLTGEILYLWFGEEDQGSSVHLERDGFEMEILVFAVPGESSEKVGRCGRRILLGHCWDEAVAGERYNLHRSSFSMTML